MTGITIAYDVTAANYARVPSGQRCGYTTGSPDIAWTLAMWQANPGAVRICQDAAASDATADVLDVEKGAATPGECAGWVKRALASFAANTRPGQRRPAIYCSASAVTSVVNALNAGGVISGVGLWVASWGIGEPAAAGDVLKAAGPFPVITEIGMSAGSPVAEVRPS